MSRVNKLFQVRICKHPIDRSPESIEVLDVAYRGQSLRQIMDEFGDGDSETILIVDGQVVDRVAWSKKRVKIGSVVDIVPHVGEAATAMTLGQLFWAYVFPVLLNIAIAFAFSYLGGKLFGQDYEESEDPGSVNYAWNPKTIRREGIIRPRLYGETMVHGNMVAQWTDVVPDPGMEIRGIGNEVLYAVVDHGEGPFPTDSLGANLVYLNDQPVGNYSGANVQERLGTMDQTCMTGFEKTKIEYTLGWNLTVADGPLTFTTPNNWVDDFEFTIAFYNGLIQYDKDGDIESTDVWLKVEVSEMGLETWTTVYNYMVSNGTRKPFYINVKLSDIHFMLLGGTGSWIFDGEGNYVWDPFVYGDSTPYPFVHNKQYDIKFTRTTIDDADPLRISPCQIKSVREVVNVAFTRPGRALLGIRAVGTEQVNDGLDVKCVRKGRVVNIFDGTSWNIGYSNLRAWIVLDALTQPIISGSGKSGDPYVIERYEGLDPANIDLAFFYEWAQLCDIQVPDGKGGVESLFTCNYNVDVKRSVYTLAYELAQIGRVKLYWEGTILTGWIDAAVTADTDLVTMDNIMAKTWKNGWNGKDEMAGTIEVAYMDKDRGYERTTYSHSNVNSGVYTRVVNVEASGETRRSGAVRMADFALNRNALIRNVNSFEMHKDALRHRLGDVIRLQVRRPDWGVNYRVVDVDSGLQTITVDRNVSGTSSGDLLYVRAYDSSGIEHISVDVYTVASVNGKSITIQETFNPVPIKNSLAAIGTSTSVPVRRRIVKIIQKVNNYYELTTETYDPDLYIRDSISPIDPNPTYVWPAPAKRKGITNQPLTWDNILNAINRSIPPQPDIDIPWISNCDFTYDSGGGTVYWNSRDVAYPITFRFRGTTYHIDAGSTTDEFIYWDPDYTTAFQHSSLASVAIAPTHWLVCGVVNGVAYPSTPIQFLHAGVILAGTIRAEQFAQLRQTMAWGPYGEEADATHTVVFDFELPSETTDVIDVKLSFNIKPFRATSTTTSSSGTLTSDPSPGTTGSDGPVATGYDGTGSTSSGSGSTDSTSVGYTDSYYINDVPSSHSHSISGTHSHGIGSHTHTGPSHYHSIAQHTHPIGSHIHILQGHAHGITYGIYEESNTPNLTYAINDGSGYGAESATYNADQYALDITPYITFDTDSGASNHKSIRFTVSARCRITARVMAKVDVTA